jgi:hypothetical protein
MVSALERGACQPSLGTMLALQGALGLSSIELLLGQPATSASRTLISLAEDPGS